jgi:hypothetical protein
MMTWNEIQNWITYSFPYRCFNSVYVIVQILYATVFILVLYTNLMLIKWCVRGDSRDIPGCMRRTGPKEKKGK